jgi:hypothetical protein
MVLPKDLELDAKESTIGPLLQRATYAMSRVRYGLQITLFVLRIPLALAISYPRGYEQAAALELVGELEGNPGPIHS